MSYKVIYYEEISGECPIKDFIDGRKERNQVKIFNLFELLEEYGPQLPRPYADLLRDGIHELRVKLSGNQFRVLYFFVFREYIVLTHAFNKTTGRVPNKEIKRAVSYRGNFLSRYKTQTQLEKEL